MARLRALSLQQTTPLSSNTRGACGEDADLKSALGPSCQRCRDTGYYMARGTAAGAPGLYTLRCDACGYWPAYYQVHAGLGTYAGSTLETFNWARLADERAHAPRHRGKLPAVIHDLATGYAHDMETFLRGYQDALLTHIQQGRGIYFYGGFGAGKSRLMCALLKKACLLGVPAERLNEEEYLQKLRDSYDEQETDGSGSKSESAGALFRHYADIALLGLDEFCGAGHKDGREGWAARELSALLDARHRAGRTTLFTSNRPLGALDGEFLTGVISRIRGSCFVLEVIAPDYRDDVQAQNLREEARGVIRTSADA